MSGLIALMKAWLASLRDLMPVILVVSFFQLVVIQQPLPHWLSILGGLFLVILGLTLFVFGLEIGLFPLGETMAQALARKGSVTWLMAFAFFLGFGTTIAEPALTAIAQTAGQVAARGGMIADTPQSIDHYVQGLRFTVALSVGGAIMLGVLRILKGWPIQRLIMGGYFGVMLLTLIAPASIIGVAYDSGGVTTSTITVPLVTALGIGLSSSIKGRNPMIDGFGLIAFASLLPMMFVMVYGMLVMRGG